MSREGDLLSKSLEFSRQRSSIITAHLIKARAASISRLARERHMEAAIAEARSIVDELVTTKAALDRGEQKGNAA